MNHPKSIRLLLADNSEEYRRSVHGFLELEGYVVEEVGSPHEARKRLGTGSFDLVLVDLRLQSDENPNDMSGLEVAKFASERGIACILVTAFPSFELARAALRSRGAESYAKDMITKGSDPQVVLDSIALTLRHARSAAEPAREHAPLHTNGNGLYLDKALRLVFRNKKPMKLSKNQYVLLEALLEEPGRVCTYAELLAAIYKEEVDDRYAAPDQRLRNLAERTNAKLKDKKTDPDRIEAVPGRGYRLNLPS